MPVRCCTDLDAGRGQISGRVFIVSCGLCPVLLCMEESIARVAHHARPSMLVRCLLARQGVLPGASLTCAPHGCAVRAPRPYDWSSFAARLPGA